MPRRRFFALALAAALTAAVLTGCSAQSAAPADPAQTGVIPVVASTDVWGSVASAIGGDHVAVTSIIDDPSKDPHDYQADARNQLAISQARVVIDNGGGYDDFVSTMVAAARTRPTVLTAATISGYDQHPATGDFNEHLWYDFPTVRKVAQAMASTFAKEDPRNAASFQSNLTRFDAQLSTLQATERELKSRYGGAAVMVTEPVPLYMLDAIGLKNVTPAKFSEAIENDTDVAPAVLQQTLDLFASGKVKLLAYNEQTSGAQTELVLDAAKQNNVAVVPVTETLPAGKNYIEWMTANLSAIGQALK